MSKRRVNTRSPAPRRCCSSSAERRSSMETAAKAAVCFCGDTPGAFARGASRLAPKAREDAFELIQTRVMDDDAAGAFARRLDPDRRTEPFRELAFKSRHIGVDAP